MGKIINTHQLVVKRPASSVYVPHILYIVNLMLSCMYMYVGKVDLSFPFLVLKYYK